MEENPDLISLLPNQILHQIISNLSFKEAVQTSLLSTSWRSLMSPTHLNLDSPGADLISGAGFHILKLHVSSHHAAPFAICTKGVTGDVHLSFSEHEQLYLSEPASTALILRQDSFIPRTRRRLISCISLTTIKTLHIVSVSHLVGGMVSDLCSSCSFLESLTLEKCHGLQRVEIEANESLKKLEIAECFKIVGVWVSAKNLKSMSYKGVLALLELVEVPNLSAVTLDFGDGFGGYVFDIQDSLSLLSSIKDIHTLNISSWLIEALCCAGVVYSKLDFEMSRLKDLKVMICSKISSKTRDSLACFLHMAPSLEELHLTVEQGSRSLVEIPYSYQHWHDPHLWRDYAWVKKEAGRLKYMKRIKIKGFELGRDELLWMDLLLHNAINLKEMIFDDSWRVVRVPCSQLSYITTFTHFLVPFPDFRSHFVFIAISSNF